MRGRVAEAGARERDMGFANEARARCQTNRVRDATRLREGGVDATDLVSDRTAAERRVGEREPLCAIFQRYFV